ncbi:MAG: fibro-slime domain-containing protein [Myxococcales bacterium]|nr:MAG: fibro-slime domain-containing protein [Myxococcales bacterium]
MKPSLFFLLLLLLTACGISNSATSTTNGDPCANGPAEGGCGTECTLNPAICADGFFCGGDGLCTAQCNESKGAMCSNAQRCTSDGRCVATSQPASDSGVNSTECVDELLVLIRDFQSSHPDFEIDLNAKGISQGLLEKNIVTASLDSNRKPVFNTTEAPFVTVENQASFDQWFRNVDSVNQAIEKTLPLTRGTDGALTYDSDSFFPIDGEGFGNTQGQSHNYHFTMELHSKFSYKGGEVFTFQGDDDLFLFINGKLAIDLGGVHAEETDTADMDALASSLGIEIGNTYDLDLFFAERHTTESNFRIETSIECIVSEDDVF